ncbi:MAG TPA: hypothetical protein VL383_14395 [Gemmatimonadaceae bacterium]|nr:hypothetical protein [Gemmatimonadaceae bacterium]
MSAIRRFAAALSGALLLQLSLLASGTLCHVHGSHPAAAMAHSGMHGQHGPATRAVGDAAAQMPAGGCDMSGSSAPCEAPWAPGGCGSMSTCVSVTSAISTWTGHLAQRATQSVEVVSSAAMPLGPAFAPELPPPRA